MGLFGKKKDWNVIAVMFESKGQFRMNGNRAKAAAAVGVRDGAKNHERTVFWAVFDQKRAFLEGGPGAGAQLVPTTILTRLTRELPKLTTVREILEILEAGKTDKIAKAWSSETPADG